MPPAPLGGAMGVVGTEAAWAPFERCSGVASGRLEEVQSRTPLSRVKAAMSIGKGDLWKSNSFGVRPRVRVIPDPVSEASQCLLKVLLGHQDSTHTSGSRFIAECRSVC